MFKDSAIYEELSALNSPLADVSNVNVFSVPGNYFASLPAGILQYIYGQSPINELNRENLNREVPEGYFDGLADSILSRIRAEKAADYSKEEDIAFLSGVQGRNVFTVPAGYFDGVAESILRKLHLRPAKVITMKSRSSFFNYAAAAAITGILGFSIFSVLDKKSTIETITPSSSLIMAQAGQILKTNSFDSEMDALGDEEIVGYLKNNGEDINAALVASVTDDQALPNEDEYYTDEKTLDNFLNGLNVIQASNN